MARGKAPPSQARLWAALLAVYGLIMHVPAMAAMGQFPAAPAVVLSLPQSEHHHGDGQQATHSHSALCCSTCLTAVGLVGPAAPSVPAPLHIVACRNPRPRSAKPRRFRTTAWQSARGPPAAV